MPIWKYSIVLAISLIMAGCGGQPVEETPVVEEAEAPPTAAETVEMPEPTAEAVWTYMEEAGFTDNWSFWPGRGAFAESQVPHGLLVTAYLNPVAFDAISGAAGSVPEGSIIVKENYSPDRELMATTVMYKSAGFDPEHNDWFWLRRLADGTVAASGQIEGCQNCHGMGADNDYLLTESIQ